MTAKKARVDGRGCGAVAEPRGAAYLTLMASILPADPTLDEARRESLWQARVDALQQAAGFVGTQRLLAAHGRSDALLVSVD